MQEFTEGDVSTDVAIEMIEKITGVNKLKVGHIQTFFTKTKGNTKENARWAQRAEIDKTMLLMKCPELKEASELATVS